MKKFLEELQKQVRENKSIIKTAEGNISKAPRGTLRITHSKARALYYQSFPEQEGKSRYHYIRKENMNIAAALAQKDYDMRVVEAAKKQNRVISDFLRLYDPYSVISIFENLKPERKHLISPCKLSDAEYTAEWLSKQAETAPFRPEGLIYLTERGEMVRSKSEKIIADKLFSSGIPYKYECPLMLDSGITVHPDFTILLIKTREEKYWEHLGMMDNMGYISHALEKIEQYERTGILPGQDLILTHETSERPLDIKILNKIIGTLI